MRKIFFITAAIIGSVIVLQQAQFVLSPLVLALLLSISISPVVGFLERKKWNSTLAILLTSLVLFTLLVGVVTIISKQYYNMIDGLPMLGEKTNELLQKILDLLNEYLGLDKQKLMAGLGDYTDKLQSTMTGVLESVWSSVSGFLSFMVMLPIFMILILMNRQKLKNFFYQLPTQEQDLRTWEKTADALKSVVRNYIMGLLIVVVILAVLNSIGLLILGIPFAIALGLSSAVLSILPYLGNLLGGSLAVLVAFATKDNPLSILGVLIMILVVQFLEGNLITPKVMGNKVNINAIVTIVALLVWGFVWGILGMILAVPMTAMIHVLLEHSKKTKAYADLMGE